jgi:hypothetical protein
MSSTSTNHGSRHIGINGVKYGSMDRSVMISIMREMVFDEETVCWTIYLIVCHAEQQSGN